MNDFFNSSLGLRLSPKNVVGEIIRFMLSDAKRSYRIVIGTDSLLASDKSADFVTAIVVHRVGNGGRYFWRRFELKPFHTLRDRIIREVLLSLEVAKGILEELKNQEAPHFDFEIHADIGENGETKVMIQEVVGMIRAHNFEARTKPMSYAASSVADRHV
ncbi:MAG: ribonuclease H-like YkuK family protein [bacterium]|nr:ribonuclease H-like YkuK family protein [bacterium]